MTIQADFESACCSTARRTGWRRPPQPRRLELIRLRELSNSAAPAITGTRPRAIATAISMSVSCSVGVNVGASPVVPHTTSAVAPARDGDCRIVRMLQRRCCRRRQTVSAKRAHNPRALKRGGRWWPSSLPQAACRACVAFDGRRGCEPGLRLISSSKTPGTIMTACGRFPFSNIANLSASARLTKSPPQRALTVLDDPIAPAVFSDQEERNSRSRFGEGGSTCFMTLLLHDEWLLFRNTR